MFLIRPCKISLINTLNLIMKYFKWDTCHTLFVWEKKKEVDRERERERERERKKEIKRERKKKEIEREIEIKRERDREIEREKERETHKRRMREINLNLKSAILSRISSQKLMLIEPMNMVIICNLGKLI